MFLFTFIYAVMLPVLLFLPPHQAVAAPVYAEIQINGRSDEIQVRANEKFSVDISLDAYGLSDRADWWLLHVKPDGAVDHFDLLSLSFQLGLATTYQGETASFNSWKLPDMSCSRPGSHTFYFGIDTNADNRLDPAALFYGGASLTVLPLSEEPGAGDIPFSASDWRNQPVHGAVIEIGYGGPDEYNSPPYPSVQSLATLRKLGVEIITLEFQYIWTIFPPYRADEARFRLLEAALDNVKAAGLHAVVAVRNGPGRNAMMPDIANRDVITVLYSDETAVAAWVSMLQDMVSRLKGRDEIIAWEPMVEPAPDWFLEAGEEAPFPEASAVWNRLAERFISAIRQADPLRPILIEPVNWGGVDGFIRMQCFDDDNIIYSLHTYEPYAYTHQDTAPYTVWPGLFEDEYYDATALASLLAPVDAFQQRCNNATIVVGEWGGIRWIPGMEQYISEQIALFAQRGWSWFWYAWDDEEWDELGFELQMGPVRENPQYDPATPAFAPVVSAWRNN